VRTTGLSVENNGGSVRQRKVGEERFKIREMCLKYINLICNVIMYVCANVVIPDRALENCLNDSCVSGELCMWVNTSFNILKIELRGIKC
jgi:hypothetical protein